MADHSSPGLSPEDLLTLNRAATVARLLAGVAHEVNNALLVIGATAELLEDRPGLPDPLVKGLQRIRSQGARAAGAVSDVLSLTRERADLHSRVNLRDIVSRAVTLRTYSIARAGLTIALDAPPAAVFIVEGNRVQLQQAVLNLIANAEQALAGTRGGAIRVEMSNEGEQILVRVADNGPGIPPDLGERIFEPFVTTRSHLDSSGLGLTAARMVATGHRGSLAFEPGGQGATFVLRLPRAH
jgi:two-component system C4-dicarboxylate transport sensor histidine kinase DctB